MAPLEKTFHMPALGWAQLGQAANQSNWSYKHSLSVFGTVWDVSEALLTVIRAL